MSIKRNALLALMSLAVVGVGASAASAAPHPRVAQVDGRAHRQIERIETARREGLVGPHKAVRLERADYRVLRAERRMAGRHEGHLTRFEQARLNHAETRIGRRIPG